MAFYIVHKRIFLYRNVCTDVPLGILYRRWYNHTQSSYVQYHYAFLHALCGPISQITTFHRLELYVELFGKYAEVKIGCNITLH